LRTCLTSLCWANLVVTWPSNRSPEEISIVFVDVCCEVVAVLDEELASVHETLSGHSGPASPPGIPSAKDMSHTGNM
jgi:hypothetical protein